MRVCHVVECGGGVGNVVVDLVQAGLAAGDDVTVIYGAARAWPRFLEALQGLKRVTMIASSMRRAVGFHDIIDALRLCLTLHCQGPFDVINAHSSKAGALVRLLRPFLPKSVVIYTPHAFVTLAPEASAIYGWIEKILSPFCDVIVCLSQQEKQHAVATLKIAPQKICVIPNGIDLNFTYDRAAARSEIGASDSDFIVGFIGRLETQKNPLRAIEAFAEAAAKYPALRLVMVGDGVLKTQAEQAIASHNIKDKVKFITGFNGRSLAAGFDCLLCSSDYEGFGLVVLEALAAGVPVVMTPVGASEAVLSGKTGTVTTSFSSHELANGIDALADATIEQRQQISLGCKTQVQNFSRERMTSATRDLYLKLSKK